MLRFLLTRRWLGLLLVVVVVALACVRLGLWQFDRYGERHDRNATTRANLDAEPAPVADVLSTQADPTESDEWRSVEATGVYDTSHQVVVLYRTREGAPGVDVVTPLLTGTGTALLVDRGWVASKASGSERPDLPAPPAGTVTVTGWVRRNAGGGNATTPADGAVRAISSDSIGETLPYDVFDGFVDLTGEEPSVKPAPAKAEPPSLGAGPSFFYGLQWFFFAALALGFWVYFAQAEYRQADRQTTAAPSDARKPERLPDRDGDVTARG